MVKTQVQMPDHLYNEAKRIPKEYEMSFAEVVRRGLERVVPVYPPRKPATKWSPPSRGSWVATRSVRNNCAIWRVGMTFSPSGWGEGQPQKLATQMISFDTNMLFFAFAEDRPEHPEAIRLVLRAHGVTEFATANVKDFQGFGFRRVWNPLETPSY